MKTMRIAAVLSATTLSFITLSTSCTCAQTCFQSPEKGEFASYYKDLPFDAEEVCRPSIPSFTVHLSDFDGNGNGIQDNTLAFKNAMEALSAHGGGHLVVDAGIWKTGPIEILSNIDLHLDKNAVLLFDPSRNLYPIIGTSFEGLDTYRCESPIHAQDACNISISGSGVIDGSGHAWRPVKKSKVTSSQWKNLVASGGVTDEKGSCWYPSREYIEAEKLADMNVIPSELMDSVFRGQLENCRDFLRPVMVSLRNCTNVLLEGCTFQNSPAWNIHPLMCKNLIVKDITVRNPWYAQNGDGIDIESCTDVLLIGSTFDVGDDGICIKSGKDEDGRRRAIPTKGLIVDDCTVYHGHGGFVVGSEMSGGVENVKVSNCRFLGTDVGLRFKSKRGRGGVVKNIHISDIYMTDIVTETLLFDLFYGGKSAVEALEDGDRSEPAETLAVDETTPSFRDIYISNVVCNGAGRAMYFNGLPEMPVKNVNISGCVISSTTGIEICHSEDVTLKDVKVTPQKGEPVTCANVKNFKME